MSSVIVGRLDQLIKLTEKGLIETEPVTLRFASSTPSTDRAVNQDNVPFGFEGKIGANIFVDKSGATNILKGEQYVALAMIDSSSSATVVICEDYFYAGHSNAENPEFYVRSTDRLIINLWSTVAQPIRIHMRGFRRVMY